MSNWKYKLEKFKKDRANMSGLETTYTIKQKSVMEYSKIATNLFKVKVRKYKYYIKTKQGLVRV